MRLLHGADRRRAGKMLHKTDLECRRKADRHRRRSRQCRAPSPVATGLPRRAGWSMRLLPVRDPDLGQSAARQKPEAFARGDCAGARWQYLPLRLTQPHHACG